MRQYDLILRETLFCRKQDVAFDSRMDGFACL